MRATMARMRAARNIEEFLDDPIERYSVGKTHLVWCHSATLVGTVHWGKPTENDARELVKRLDISIQSALAGGFSAVMDTRGMEAFAWPSFSIVAAYVKQRLAQWSKRIRRHAVVVPAGPVGVLVAGLMPLIGTSHPLRFFTSLAEAIDWLNREELAPILEEVAQLVEDARGVAPVIRSLREHLDQSLQHPSVQLAAQSLGLSARSLQRELSQHGTRFSHELTQARLRAACTLLEHSDDKIESIARRVGCASSSQLSAIFRQNLGETPARYRARRRG
jgi:AraC-like DNA-binding protein